MRIEWSAMLAGFVIPLFLLAPYSRLSKSIPLLPIWIGLFLLTCSLAFSVLLLLNSPLRQKLKAIVPADNGFFGERQMQELYRLQDDSAWNLFYRLIFQTNLIKFFAFIQIGFCVFGFVFLY